MDMKDDTEKVTEDITPEPLEDGNVEEVTAEVIQPDAEDAELNNLNSEIDTLKDQLLRLRADFDNYRRRMMKESDQVRRTAAEGLIRELLPVADNLERALQHSDSADTALAQGVQMVLKQFQDVLKHRGVEPVPGAGAPFDPNVHEALAQQASDEVPADHVVLEYERGYRIGDQILRPAKVIVSSGPSA